MEVTCVNNITGATDVAGGRLVASMGRLMLFAMIPHCKTSRRLYRTIAHVEDSNEPEKVIDPSLGLSKPVSRIAWTSQ